MTLRLFALFFVALAACADNQLLREFHADRQLLHRFFDSDLSADSAMRIGDFYQTQLLALQKQPFADLDRSGQVDFLLLQNHLRQRLFFLQKDATYRDLDAEFLPFVAPILALELARQKMEPLVEADAAAALSEIATGLETLRETVDKRLGEQKEDSGIEQLPPEQAQRLAQRTQRCKQKLEHWYKQYAGYRPGFAWWMKKPYEAASKALDEYAKVLREKGAGIKEDADAPLIGQAVGADTLAAMIGFEMLPYSAEELLAIGEKEFAWCEDRMEEAAQTMGLTDRFAALEAVKKKHVAPGKQDELVAQYAHEAAAFVEENDLVTVPPLCKELWDVRMIAPENLDRLPYALYRGNSVVVAFAADVLEHEEKLMSMRGNNLHATRIVTAHEVIPGHHLQIFYGSRYRTDRHIFRTPFYVEGWSLYWEMLLWDKGFARGPEDEIGMLFWRMHRCARIIVTLKFHLGQMAPEEMVTFLIDQVGHEEEPAKSEVRRFIGPGWGVLYQAGYMLGGLQIRALQRELVPETMSMREFHDAILRQGPIPIEMLRAQLTDGPLSAEFAPSWQFYEAAASAP
jgi:hypothetical protein